MRFEELSLIPGSRFSLQLLGLDYKTHRFEVELLGFEKQQSLLVKLLQKPTKVLLQQGQSVTAEIITATGVAQFETAIEVVDEIGLRGLFLDYPAVIDFQLLRHQVRVPIDEPVSVIGHTRIGMQTDPLSGFLQDISVSGACLALRKELTEMVSFIRLSSSIAAFQRQYPLEIRAELRSDRQLSSAPDNCPFVYGVEFTDISDQDYFFLQAYCLHKASQNRVLLCAVQD